MPKLEYVAQRLLPGHGQSARTWEENGDRLIAVGHSGDVGDRGTQLLRWTGTSLQYVARVYTHFGAAHLDTWEENTDRLIVAGTQSTMYPDLHIFRWNGSELTQEDIGLEFDPSVRGLHTWGENGDRMIGVATITDNLFHLLRWNGTSVVEETTYTLPGSVRSVYSWEENGDRIIAVSYDDPPFFSLLRWNGTSLTEAATYQLSDLDRDGAGHAIYSWEENGDRLIITGHPDITALDRGSLTLMSWDGVQLSEKFVINALLFYWTYDIYGVDYYGSRLIAVGTYGSPYFSLLRWEKDKEELNIIDSYELANDGYGVHPWKETASDTLIAVAHYSPPGFVLLRARGVPAPILSSAQENSNIQVSWTYP